jgi:hypothetical protein
MARFTEQTNVGVRWLTCGRRLFLRNPALLGGMGFCMALLITLLSVLPMVGGMLIASLAPALLASIYLTLDAVSKEKRPEVLHIKALKQSPRELFGVFREEKRVIPVIVACLFTMVTAVLVRVLIQAIAGSAWVKEWTSLGIVPLLEIAAALLVALVVYFVVAWLFVYALPLAFLQRRPLFPAMRRSFKASMHHAFGLLVIFGFLLLPLVVGVAASFAAQWLAYTTALLTGTLVLPMVAASLYCSYRTIFPMQEGPNVADGRSIRHGMPSRHHV